jgi:predicted amidohydrolase
VSQAVTNLAVYQFAPRLRDAASNLVRIAAVVESSRADLVLTPELSVTGYDLGDDAAALAVRLEHDAPFPLLANGAATALIESPSHTVLGLVEMDESGTPFNAAAIIQLGAVRFLHRKIYLPTYGMFDEARWFGRGNRLDVYDHAYGMRVGVLVCEDFWHPGLSYVLAAAGIHVLLVLAAAPGRGVWQGGENGSLFASVAVWERIARVTAQVYGIYVALANRTGVEGGVTFAGGSLIVGPAGDVVARAGSTEEAVLEAEISTAEVERARRPYHHARDDDPRLVRRELTRLLRDA